VEESGVPAPIELKAVHGQDQPQQRALQIAQANLAEIGITLSIQVVDVAAQLEAYRSGNYEFGLNWWGYRPDPDNWIHQKYHSKGSQNYYGYYNSPRADELIEQAQRSSNLEERVRLYRQLADLLNDDAPQIFFHYGSNVKGLSKRVDGFVHFQDSMIRFQTVSLG
jgi:peptide/nickel transport system substrate-binding protein